MGESSVDAFTRKLNERYNEFASGLNATITNIATNLDAKSRRGTITELYLSTDRLFHHLSPDDRPEWLSVLHSALLNYSRDDTAQNADALVRTLMKFHRVIKPIRFDDGGATIDFDAIYASYRSDGRIGELFDELIRIVNQIIESGEVDSASALATLQQIVSLLRSNRDGSFLAVKSTILSVRFLFNLVDVTLRELPVIKQLRQAYECTVNDGIKEVDAIEAKIRDAAIVELAKRLPKNVALPNYCEATTEFLEPLALPAPDPPDSTSPE